MKNIEQNFGEKKGKDPNTPEKELREMALTDDVLKEIHRIADERFFQIRQSGDRSVYGATLFHGENAHGPHNLLVTLVEDGGGDEYEHVRVLMKIEGDWETLEKVLNVPKDS